ncbi:MAG: ABC transporter permease [Bacteroidales bacterium]|nr:ABC transporter permease [Bacteroidales bacterium]
MKLFRLRSLTTLPSLLNITGIAIAIATFYILMAVADNSLTFNRSIKDQDRICQIIYESKDASGGEWSNNFPRPFGIAFGDGLPQIEKYGCLRNWGIYDGYIENGGHHSKINFNAYGCDNGLPEVFGFNIVEGDISRFKTGNDLIITRSMADKYKLKIGDIIFPDLNNLNRTLEIVAIYEDLKNNTEFGQLDGFTNIGDENLTNRNQWNYTFYLKLKEGVNPEETLSNSKEAVKDIIRVIYKDDTSISKEFLENAIETFKMNFLPIKNIHLHPQIAGYHRHNDAKMIYTFVILSILVLAIAFINYFNFFMARAPKRIKDININKILGCERPRLVLSIVGESIIFTLVSIVLAIVISHTVMPWIVDGIVDMEKTVFPNYKILTISILISIGAAVLTSLYPALHITSLPPALALKGQITESNRNPLRLILVGFQIAASIALIICSLFIQKNNSYIMSRDIGYNKKNLLTIWCPPGIVQKNQTVRNRLLENPQITDITWSNDPIVRPQGTFWSIPSKDNPEESYYFDVLWVSKNFVNCLGLEITNGRNFTESDTEDTINYVMIFNETARKRLNLTTETQIGGISDEGNIIITGFCNDFNFKPLQYDITSCALFLCKDGEMSHLYIRYADDADFKSVREYILNTLTDIDPNFAVIQPELKTFDQQLSENYQNENATSSMITIFTVIAIIISVMGIFGIVLFETESRRKEIGIRKVNGATIVEILSMFNRKYLILAAICSAIAIPVSFFAVNTYFSGFAYHYPIAPWIFAIGIIIAVGITALVVTAASFRAANENPVKTLKSE